MITVKFHDAIFHFPKAKNYDFKTIKTLALMKILEQKPSSKEFANFLLISHETDIYRTENNKIEYEVTEINKEDKDKIMLHIYDVFDDPVIDIQISKPISINKLLQQIMGETASEYFLTKKGSSEVLMNEICVSTEITCLSYYFLYCSVFPL